MNTKFDYPNIISVYNHQSRTTVLVNASKVETLHVDFNCLQATMLQLLIGCSCCLHKNTSIPLSFGICWVIAHPHLLVRAISE